MQWFREMFLEPWPERPREWVDAQYWSPFVVGGFLMLILSMTPLVVLPVLGFVFFYVPWILLVRYKTRNWTYRSATKA